MGMDQVMKSRQTQKISLVTPYFGRYWHLFWGWEEKGYVLIHFEANLLWNFNCWRSYCQQEWGACHHSRGYKQQKHGTIDLLPEQLTKGRTLCIPIMITQQQVFTDICFACAFARHLLHPVGVDHFGGVWPVFPHLGMGWNMLKPMDPF